MNATDHIIVGFRKFDYDLMNRVIAISSTVMLLHAILDSDAYFQSPLMNNLESILSV